MKYKKIEQPQTGVAIPISGLKSSTSCGIGEFNDLIPLAEWSASCGMDLIQILPINDSGLNSSPYSALSAFALNPIYIHLPDLDGFTVDSHYEQFKKQVNSIERIPYQKIYEFKQYQLQQNFEAHYNSISKKRALSNWIKENPWILDYAAFQFYKIEQGQKAWFHWENNKQSSPESILALWKSNKKDLLFDAWVQWELENQLLKTVAQVQKIGIQLKGDIPILINEDSADVWSNPNLFDNSFRAGAPPDMFAMYGQNWGFPCYNWDELEKSNYTWWKDRLKQCDKFFHAIRIDHVLGFFRIWRIASTEKEGILGHFHPSIPVYKTHLNEHLDEFTFKRLIHPYFTKDQLNDFFSTIDYDWNFLVDLENDFYRLKDEFCNEKKITDLAGSSKELKTILLSLYWNRLFTIRADGELSPYWYWYKSPTWNTLNQSTQDLLSGIIHDNEGSQDELWEKEGTKILTMMKSSTSMLVCAEDLGAIPPCVPKVLNDLSIYSLKIERWAKEWNQPGEPYTPLDQYPKLSVCTPSCHDTSTLRGWWEESNWDKKQYLGELQWKEAPDFLSIELTKAILLRNLKTSSQITIFPLQDWLALTYDFRTYHSEEERINVPGTVNEVNWNWKMKPTLSELMKNQNLKAEILTLIEQRKDQNL